MGVPSALEISHVYFPADAALSLLDVTEDVQDAGVVGGFDVVQVRSPDELVVFLPCHVDPLAASVSALQPQEFTQLVADIL